MWGSYAEHQPILLKCHYPFHCYPSGNKYISNYVIFSNHDPILQQLHKQICYQTLLILLLFGLFVSFCLARAFLKLSSFIISETFLWYARPRVLLLATFCPTNGSISNLPDNQGLCLIEEEDCNCFHLHYRGRARGH